LRSPEDFVHVGRGASVQFRRIGAIGQKGSDLQQPFRCADQNYSVLCCEVPDLLSMQRQYSGTRDDKGLGSLVRCRLERPFKITRCPHLKRLELYSQHGGRALCLAELGIGMIWVPQAGYAGYPRCRFFEQLNSLSGQLVVNIRDTRDISTWPREARHEPACDGIVAHDNHNRDRSRRCLDDWGLFAAERKDHVWTKTD